MTDTPKRIDIWTVKPFNQGVWAIVDEDNEIQSGAHGWAVSPHNELDAWERLLAPCQEWSITQAKESGCKAVFLSAIVDAPAPPALKRETAGKGE